MMDSLFPEYLGDFQIVLLAHGSPFDFQVIFHY